METGQLTLYMAAPGESLCENLPRKENQTHCVVVVVRVRPDLLQPQLLQPDEDGSVSLTHFEKTKLLSSFFFALHLLLWRLIRELD